MTQSPFFLGVHLGLNAALDTWAKMIPKYKSAARQVASMGLGLAPAMGFYNMLVHSQLHYRAQLFPIHKLIADADNWAIQLAAKGPFNATSSPALRSMKRTLGFKVEALDIRTTALVAPAAHRGTPTHPAPRTSPPPRAPRPRMQQRLR